MCFDIVRVQIQCLLKCANCLIRLASGIEDRAKLALAAESDGAGTSAVGSFVVFSAT